jgi:predicted ribosome quality control (RQC) complex YloA/Tae2 family protein
MPFDAYSIHALKNELNKNLINSRIGKIFQPDQETIVLEAFHPYPRKELKILISIHPQFYRTHLMTEKCINPPQPPAFCMLLRKYLQGGRIICLDQPLWERILIFRIENYQPEGRLTTFSLIFEAMGRSSNLLLVNTEGMVIDALKRLPDGPKRKREIMPGTVYSPPSPPVSYHPNNITFSALQRIIQLSSAALELSTVLSKEIFGLSRSLVLEVLHRAGISTTATVGDSDLEVINRIFNTLVSLDRKIQEDNYSAFLYLDERGKPIDFFPYKPLHLPVDKLISVPNLITAIESTLQHLNEESSLQRKADRLKKVLKEAKKKALKKRSKQEVEFSNAEDANTYQLYGELITVHLGEITRGQTELLASNYYDPEGGSVLIPLDPALSPVENSQFYYKKYNKAKKGLDKIQRQLNITEIELDYLASLENSLQEPYSFEDLMEIEEEMQETGLLKMKSKSKPRSRPLPVSKPSVFRAGDGWEILVGRNNKQNDQLTMKIASPGDLWLHTQKIPGSHVIIRSQGKTVTKDILLEAANLAVYFSKAQGSSKVPVDYTEKRHVRKPSGSRPGFVLYDHFQTLIIDPDAEILEKFGLR